LEVPSKVPRCGESLTSFFSFFLSQRKPGSTDGQPFPQVILVREGALTSVWHDQTVRFRCPASPCSAELLVSQAFFAKLGLKVEQGRAPAEKWSSIPTWRCSEMQSYLYHKVRFLFLSLFFSLPFLTLSQQLHMKSCVIFMDDADEFDASNLVKKSADLDFEGALAEEWVSSWSVLLGEEEREGQQDEHENEDEDPEEDENEDVAMDEGE
jgi:hypothetical protein